MVLLVPEVPEALEGHLVRLPVNVEQVQVHSDYEIGVSKVSQTSRTVEPLLVENDQAGRTMPVIFNR